MRIAHLADLHLGFRQYHRLNPNGINQREADVANAFRAAVDGVLLEQPDAVIVAGDLFHAVRPTNQAIVFAFKQFQRLREGLPDAPIIVIAGNHDTPRSSETGSILKLFEELGIDVAADKERRLVYPKHQLSVLAVPHEALFAADRPELRPAGDELFQVLVLHGEVEGIFPADRSSAEHGGAHLTERDLTGGDWTYVALGHYHVQTRVRDRVWYSGSLEYVSSNPWGELAEERAVGRSGGEAVGKSWLLVDLRTGKVESTPITLARKIFDLPPIDAADLSPAEIDKLIADRVGSITGGLEDQVARLVVRNIPRHVARELDHAKLREYKGQALHFHLDLRRPDAREAEAGNAGPGRRATLPEIVVDYLGRRPLPSELDREGFVATGKALIERAERDYAEEG
ncbi:MAG TPA: exonuclease SbcCD subunit D [Gemmatimonadales bacterium]|nr:exonuclease SbcCD subunit D [Gemmatimonadales bacterium]